MKKLTQEMKKAGARAMKDLSDKAYTVYSNTDPLDVYKTDDTFSIRGCLGDIDGMTFAELESMLESLVTVRKYWRYSRGSAQEITEEEAKNSIEIPYDEYSVTFNPSPMTYDTGEKFIAKYENLGEGMDYFLMNIEQGLDLFKESEFKVSSIPLDFYEYLEETEDGIVIEEPVPLGFAYQR